MVDIKDKIIKETQADLVKLLNERRESLQKFRFGISGSKTRNVKEARGIRRDIARILTELNSRKIGIAKK